MTPSISPPQSTNQPPTESLWGRITTCHTVAPGIYRVSTSSHGGYILSDERLAQMPPALRHPNGRSFEEDCLWCLVPLAFPDLFPADEHDLASATCRNWFPDIWEAWTGTVLDPKDSFKKKERVFFQHHQHDWIVCAAWGDWHPAVPKGFVAGRAHYGGHRIPPRDRLLPPARYFLIPYHEYEQSRPFIIDLTRHHEIPVFPE